jgi:transposase
MHSQRPTKGKPLMHSAAFELAIKQTRCRGKAAEAARQVLVGGSSQADAAASYNVSRNAVSKVCRRIIEAGLRLGACPMCGRPR